MKEAELKELLENLMENDDVLYVNCVARSDDDDLIIITGIDKVRNSREITRAAKLAAKEFHKEWKAGEMDTGERYDQER